MNTRSLALGIGLVALAASLVAIVYPGVFGLELERILLVMVGVFAILLGLRTIQRTRRQARTEAETPDPELPVTPPPPGDDLQDAIAEFLGSRRVRTTQNRARDALRTAAVSVLWRYAGYSRPEAEAAVEDGTWSEDMYAVSFLGGPNTPMLPLRSRLAAVLDRQSGIQRQIRHTVDEIASLAGLDPLSPNGHGDGPDSSDEPRSPGRQASETSRQDSRTGTEPRQDAVSDGGASELISRRTHATGHWEGVIVVALIGIGVGVIVEEPGILLAGVVGIGFAAYARSTLYPPGEISIDRVVEQDRPEPGEPVEVTVTVTNESEHFLPDLRLVDGVPPALRVESGSPRVGTTLRAGEQASVTYTVTARRGVHDFGETSVLVRDLAGSLEQEQVLKTESTLTCVPTYRALSESVPLRNQATQYVGQLETDTGGEGTEFFATRDYRRGDAKRHIDWKRHARTGELTTIMFREERTATVVLLIDSRSYAYVSPSENGDHAVDRLVAAAGTLYETLTDSDNQVGIGVVGSGSCWIRPGSGTEHALSVREELGTNPALTPVPPSGQQWVSPRVSRLRTRLDSGTQVLFLTPLADGYASRIARELDEFGFPVTVLSPNACADRTSSHRLARIARALRITELRSAGIPVIDWPWADSLETVVARHTERGKS